MLEVGSRSGYKCTVPDVGSIWQSSYGRNPTFLTKNFNSSNNQLVGSSPVTSTPTDTPPKMPITFGVIGTNWITDSWIIHAHKTGQWQLSAVYSRSHDQAKAFGSKYQCSNLYTSLDALAGDSSTQAIYIASPNSLHYAQAKQMLRAKKHVILEKPATSRVSELDELFQIAKEEGVTLIEAYRHIQEANYKLLRKLLIEEKKLGPIYGASFHYASFSSRYTAVLAGETPNIFSPEFDGGSLVDVGVYPIMFALGLFGAPKSQTYVPMICRTGVDAGGVGILHYENFGVQINASKCYPSKAPLEIYGEKGTVEINKVFGISSLKFSDVATKSTEELAGPYLTPEKGTENMQEEAAEFARIIQQKDVAAAAELEELSKIIVRVVTDMRKQGGVIYPSDKK